MTTPVLAHDAPTPAPLALSEGMVALMRALAPYEATGASDTDLFKHKPTAGTIKALRKRGLIEAVQRKGGGEGTWGTRVLRLTPAGRAWCAQNPARIPYARKLSVIFQVFRLTDAAFLRDPRNGVHCPWWGDWEAPYLHEALARYATYRGSRAGFGVYNAPTLTEALDLGEKCLRALFRENASEADALLEALRTRVAAAYADVTDEWCKAHGYSFHIHVTGSPRACALFSPGHQLSPENATFEPLLGEP